MLDYTKQEDLGRFGNRWGCYATNLINIIETEKGRGLNTMEQLASIGCMFVSEEVLLSNYKDHSNVGKEKRGWSEEDDPELHFLVLDHDKAVRALMDLFLIPTLKNDYTIQKLHTKYGSHFILKVNGAYTINPDPGIEGSVVQNRKVK